MYNEFVEVRTTVINNEPYLMLNDVCRILEISNPRDVKSRLNDKGVVTTDTLTAGGKQQATFINEPNFYKVVFQSRKSQAEKFTDWVVMYISKKQVKNLEICSYKILHNGINALGHFWDIFYCKMK